MDIGDSLATGVWEGHQAIGCAALSFPEPAPPMTPALPALPQETP